MPRRRLFFHAGAREQLDLDLHLRPEHRDRIEGLVLTNIGGAMDQHVKPADELLSAPKAQLEHSAFGRLRQRASGAGARDAKVGEKAIHEKRAR
jgi:hypothetical protein